MEYTDTYNPESVYEDFIYPAIRNKQGSRVQTLPSGNDDLDYFIHKPMISLPIPKNYLLGEYLSKRFMLTRYFELTEEQITEHEQMMKEERTLVSGRFGAGVKDMAYDRAMKVVSAY